MANSAGADCLDPADAVGHGDRRGSVASSIALTVYLRGIRLFVTLFAVLNLFFMLAMSALAMMAISGDWL
jgi:hypothetical protein